MPARVRGSSAPQPTITSDAIDVATSDSPSLTVFGVLLTHFPDNTTT